MRRPTPPLNLGFAGDTGTGAELQRCLAALTARADTLSGTLTTIQLEHPPTWAQALDKVDALVMVPSSTTWSRSRHRRSTGPPPLRDADWPWGLPWLRGVERDMVDAANAELRQMFAVMNKAISEYPSTHIWFCFPEDLGIADRGMPASIWRLPELRLWANKWGLRRYAVHQCRFGFMDFPLPLGVLSSQPLNQAWFAPGWPRLREKRTGDYVGPLARRCRCPAGTHSRDTEFKGRHLRPRPSSILQTAFCEYIIANRCKAQGITFHGAGLQGRGPTLENARADDHTSDDDTDAGQASIDEDVLHLSISPSISSSTGTSSSAGTSLDHLALQALDMLDALSRIGGSPIHKLKGNQDRLSYGEVKKKSRKWLRD
jgi:hypothetical protein